MGAAESWVLIRPVVDEKLGTTARREFTMYATVIHAKIHDKAEAERGVVEDVIPMIKGAQGFVAAYFVAIDDAHGISIVVFETEEQARASAPPEGSVAAGVTLESLQVGEVIGAA
jgi:hypothetical protein